MIKSFKDRHTEDIFYRGFSRWLPPDIQNSARRKLIMLKDAMDLRDLQTRPANRLEKLKGDREGQWSIRINKKWRICFAWREEGAYEVEINDYH